MDYEGYLKLVFIFNAILILVFVQIMRQVSAGDVVLTQVVLSHSGRMLFAGTSSGSVRAIKFPLTEIGDSLEQQAHSSSVTRVSIIRFMIEYNFIPFQLSCGSSMSFCCIVWVFG